MKIVGRGWSFPPKLDDRDRLEMTEDDVDIRQAMRIIINTALGERVMRPEFGCRIHELIFDPCNGETAATAARYTREALTRWEPRVRLEEVNAHPEYNSGAIVIEIIYEIKGQNDRRNLVFPFYLTPENK
jgi:hypothetical protein